MPFVVGRLDYLADPPVTYASTTTAGDCDENRCFLRGLLNPSPFYRKGKPPPTTRPRHVHFERRVRGLPFRRTKFAQQQA
ncbi:hypothetical protein Trydic_g3048 [Trypoxylus dichotomus]